MHDDEVHKSSANDARTRLDYQAEAINLDTISLSGGRLSGETAKRGNNGSLVTLTLDTSSAA